MDSGSSGNNSQKSVYIFESFKRYQPGPVNSSYAFEREFPVLSNYQAYLPEQKHSQYELESIRNYPAGEYSNYHYVTAENLSPLYQPTVKAEIFTKKDLLRRVEQLDSGFYQPVVTCGQLHFVSSGNDITHTARSSISEAEFNDLNTAISQQSLRTARSKGNSVVTAKLAGSEINLNRALLNVKKITPDDISFLIQIPGFRESLAQFKNDRKVRKYGKRDQENDQLATGISTSRESIRASHQENRQFGTPYGDLKTAIEALSQSSTSVGNPRTGRERSTSSIMQSRPASASSIRQCRTGREASLSIRTAKQNSRAGLQTPPVSPPPRRHISRFESSQLQTGRQNSRSELIPISGLRTGREKSCSAAFVNSKPAVRSGRGQSNSSVKTGSAMSSRSSSVTTSTRSASQPRSRQSKSSASQRKSRSIPSQQANVNTAIEEQSLTLITGRSPSTSSMRTALDCESSKDVTTALLPSSEDDRQLFESLNELNSVAARELRTPTAELTARESASVTEQMQRSAVHDVLHTPQDFDRRASESAANLGASLEHRIISDDSDLRTAQASESYH